jgi:hypothetical protein
MELLAVQREESVLDIGVAGYPAADRAGESGLGQSRVRYRRERPDAGNRADAAEVTDELKIG